ncbi:MAG: hypothetical protein HDT37_06020 [Clostridiales bacterium]|nr:hypothetical protein [Clostridiales bacterium]
MKLLKKWLFPVLTCLIVAGAAVLPARVSQARDAQQFGQIHTEELKADALPVYEPLSLTDRMVLFTDRYSVQHPILSSNVGAYADDLTKLQQAQAVQELLTGSGIIPEWFFEDFDLHEHLAVSRLLLWDPAAGAVVQEPSVFYLFHWTYYTTPHSKSLSVSMDAETGLPIEVDIFDTNMSQWLPYGWDELQDMADRYFDMMGLVHGRDIEPMEPEDPDSKRYLNLYYSVIGTDVHYSVSRNPTALNFFLELDQEGTDFSSFYDG